MILIWLAPYSLDGLALCTLCDSSESLAAAGSSLSLKVFSSAILQSYKSSLSKEDFRPQRQRNEHFRGLARFPLLKKEIVRSSFMWNHFS